MLTIAFAWLLLGEPLSLIQLAGAGLVLAGVWLVSRRGPSDRAIAGSLRPRD